MANPFDYNEDEEKRQFEKNVIFGGSAEDADFLKTSEFMKKSLAYKFQDEDDDNISSNLTVKDSSTVSFSASKDNTDATFRKPRQQPTPKYNTAELIKAESTASNYTGISDFKSPYNSLDDHVMKKPQIASEEYQKLADELNRAKKTIETLNSERWTNLPVRETVKRMLSEKEYKLEGYKALDEKKELLSSVVKSHDGDAIIAVVLFLERTLNKKLFFRELRYQSDALTHYAQHLKRNGDWKELETVYKDMCLIEDAAAVRYEEICKIKDATEKMAALHEWIQVYGLKSETAEMTTYIHDEISLLEKQRQLETEDKSRQATDTVMKYHPPSSLINKPLITTVSYCALYHYDKSSKNFPDNLKKNFKLTDKQYEWAVLRPRANLHRWADIQEILTSTSWLKKKSEASAIGFGHVSTILFKAKANEEILNKYLALIANLDERIKYASRFNAHEIVIDAIVQSRDRQKMEAYRLKVAQHSKYRGKINDLLSNTSIKWR